LPLTVPIRCVKQHVLIEKAQVAWSIERLRRFEEATVRGRLLLLESCNID
jgi:hypothetical protein